MVTHKRIISGFFRYMESSNQLHVPLSQLGLKVVAIDCEMVGCVKKNHLPLEQALSKNLMCCGDGNGTHQARKGVLSSVVPTEIMSLKKTGRKPNKEISIAARCSIVGYDGSVLYDKYINPTVGTNYKIINFRTPWNGIMPHHLKGATPFRVARQEILAIISDCIVIGHHVSTDFHSLDIYNFPKSQIRDTSFHYNLRKRAGLPVDNQQGSLKTMSLALLGRRIQTRSRIGHCSVEDAMATMDLYKLEEMEWETCELQ